MTNNETELLEALKAIAQTCDNQNPSHENIWRIAHSAIEKYTHKIEKGCTCLDGCDYPFCSKEGCIDPPNF